jgi:hypothetical protein
MSDKFAAELMLDQLDTLLSSPKLTPVGERQGNEGIAVPPSHALREKGDTEPSIDVKMLRDALRAGLK